MAGRPKAVGCSVPIGAWRPEGASWGRGSAPSRGKGAEGAAGPSWLAVGVLRAASSASNPERQQPRSAPASCSPSWGWAGTARWWWLGQRGRSTLLPVGSVSARSRGDASLRSESSKCTNVFLMGICFGTGALAPVLLLAPCRPPRLLVLTPAPAGLIVVVRPSSPMSSSSSSSSSSSASSSSSPWWSTKGSSPTLPNIASARGQISSERWLCGVPRP
mmetsp:Transcript_23559/g.61477  ORF Transcript_23559/g.61477 Transcript_23559/m.61477 type:complete len:218 (-) Transcript_23559:43-696(-)